MSRVSTYSTDRIRGTISHYPRAWTLPIWHRLDLNLRSCSASGLHVIVSHSVSICSSVMQFCSQALADCRRADFPSITRVPAPRASGGSGRARPTESCAPRKRLLLGKRNGVRGGAGTAGQQNRPKRSQQASGLIDAVLADGWAPIVHDVSDSAGGIN